MQDNINYTDYLVGDILNLSTADMPLTNKDFNCLLQYMEYNKLVGLEYREQTISGEQLTLLTNNTYAQKNLRSLCIADPQINDYTATEIIKLTHLHDLAISTKNLSYIGVMLILSKLPLLQNINISANVFTERDVELVTYWLQNRANNSYL